MTTTLDQAIALARACKHSSIGCLDAGDLAACAILSAEPGSVALLGDHQGVPQLHWAADALPEMLRLAQGRKPLYLEFVPVEWLPCMEQAGFCIASEFLDFFVPALLPASEYGSYETIEFMTDGDAADVRDVSVSCRDHSRGFYGNDIQFFLKWRCEENGNMIVARDGEAIVGYCCVATYGKEGNKIVWLREVAVHPDHRGRGVGTRLVALALCYGAHHGATKAFLHADALNAGAIRVYERFGFVSKQARGQINMIRR